MQKTYELKLTSKPANRRRLRTILLLLTGLAATQCLSAAFINSQEVLDVTFQGNITPVSALPGSVTFNSGIQTGSPTESVSVNGGFPADIFLVLTLGLSTNAPGDSITNADIDGFSDVVSLINSGGTTQIVTLSPVSSLSGQTGGPTSADLSLLMAIEQFNALTIQWESLKSLNINVGTGAIVTCLSQCLSAATVTLAPHTFANLRLHEHLTGSVSLAAANTVPEPGTSGLLAALFGTGAVLIRRRRSRRY